MGLNAADLNRSSNLCMRGSTIALALAVGLTVAMTVSIVAVALAVIAATAEGSRSVR